MSEYRPWPAPTRPWAMLQIWRNLLFSHWPVEPEMLAHSIPRPLTLETFENRAWVSVVPFRMSGLRPRWAPMAVPWLSTFPQLNVRTYVSAPGGEKPGVWFYSLDAANPVAVALARLWFKLPYFAARMSTATWASIFAVVAGAGIPALLPLSSPVCIDPQARCTTPCQARWKHG